MSNTPYYAPKARFGSRYGDQTLVDGIVKDGLTDAKHNNIMGIAAEKCAEKYQFTRQQQVLTSCNIFLRCTFLLNGLSRHIFFYNTYFYCP